MEHLGIIHLTYFKSCSENSHINSFNTNLSIHQCHQDRPDRREAFDPQGVFSRALLEVFDVVLVLSQHGPKEPRRFYAWFLRVKKKTTHGPWMFSLIIYKS